MGLPSRLLLLLFLAGTAAAARPLTLEEAFALAEKESASLAADAASAEEARARVDELAAAVYPKLSIKASEQILEQAPAGRDDGGRRDRPEVRINLRQPLFSGFREFAALKAGKALAREEDAELQAARQHLYVDVVRACLDLARLQKEGETRDAVLAFTRDRLKEINHREKLGRARKSERLSVAALTADLEAGRIDEARLERAAQRVVRFLTGLNEDVDVQLPVLSAAPTLEESLKRAAGRPDVAARRAALEAAEQSLSASRREGAPTLDLDGNYYLKRTGSQEAVDWDLLFSANVPLYTGGQWAARKAQSRARLSAARANHDLALRRAALEVGTAHDDLATALAAVPLREKALALAEDNVAAQAADNRMGLVTNLDVLNALEDMQEARLNLDEARLEAVLAHARLKAALGDVP